MPVLIFGADQEELRLAFDDLEWAPLTSLFSVDSPLTLDLKPEALRSKTSNFENFLSVGKEATPSLKFLSLNSYEKIIEKTFLNVGGGEI